MISFPKTSFSMSPYNSTNVSFNEATISKGQVVSFLPSIQYLIFWFKIKNTQNISIIFLNNSVKIVQLDNIEQYGPLYT